MEQCDFGNRFKTVFSGSSHLVILSWHLCKLNDLGYFLFYDIFINFLLSTRSSVGHTKVKVGVLVSCSTARVTLGQVLSFVTSRS